MAETSNLERALSTVCSKFTNSCLNPYQKKAISEFVKGKSDIFVNLPSGYGKSLVYQALPTVFDNLTARSGGRCVASGKFNERSSLIFVKYWHIAVYRKERWKKWKKQNTQLFLALQSPG